MTADTRFITSYSLRPIDTFIWKSVEKSPCLVQIAIRILAIIIIPFEILGRVFANAWIAIYNLFQKPPEAPSKFAQQVPSLILSEHISRCAQLVLRAKNEIAFQPLTKEVSVLKLRGTLYGQAIADALGMFTEFLSTMQAQMFLSAHIEFSDRDRYSKITEDHARHVNRFPRDGWTDDTDQMVLIGYAEQESRLDSTISKEQLMARQLMNWRNNGLNGFSSIAKHSFPSRQDDASADSYRKKIGCQGLGAMTSKVLQKSHFTSDPHLAALTVWKESNAGNNHAIQKREAANGAIMRTSILGILYKDNLDQAISETIRYAKVTHADPRCIASAVALTLAIALLNTGANPADALKHAESIAISILYDEMYAVKEHLISEEREQWREIAERFEKEMHECMHAPLTELELGVEPIGYTFKSLGAAFYALREAARLMSEKDARAETVFRTVIEAIIFQGGDADTNAAPAAALVGAYLGEMAIPSSWRRGLHSQDKLVIEQQIDSIKKIVLEDGDISKQIHLADIQPIDPHFTATQSISEQKKAHSIAKRYLSQQAQIIHADVAFVSPPPHCCPKVNEVRIEKALDQTIFSWENTNGVQGAIQKDGTLLNYVVLYGVASQFNACEAISPMTPKPGTAVKTYNTDHTQGPGAQLQFPVEQVEIINNAANLGFNGLLPVLDDTTKDAIKHGYLTPQTKESADTVIRQLRENGHKIEFVCIGNIPNKKGNTQKVYAILVAAPAFGMYKKKSQITDDQMKEMEFLCALQGYRAQFYQAIQLASSNPKKQVIFKPTTPGLGVFDNRVEAVAKGFYVAAKEYQDQLREKNIRVQLQVYKGQGDAKQMADMLHLNLYPT